MVTDFTSDRPRRPASARRVRMRRSVCASPGSPAMCTIRRCPRAWRPSTTEAIAPASSAHTVDRPGCRSSGAPPITTAGRPSSSRRSGRGSSVRGSTTRTPSTRCSAHQRRYTAHSSATSSTTWNSSPRWRSASTSWIPETSCRKNESTPSVSAGRASTKPTVAAPSPDRARAAVLGRQPSSSATRRTRSRVSSETPGRPFKAKETALCETPACRAMSFIVGRRAGDRLPDMVVPLIPHSGDTFPEQYALMRFSSVILMRISH